MSKQKNIVPIKESDFQQEINRISFTKNFRSASTEEWYGFLPGFKDPDSGGAAGKAITHYNLFRNKEVFINTTVILDDPALHEETHQTLVYGIADEIENRLVGYADTLLSVHCGPNSYQAEYKS